MNTGVCLVTFMNRMTSLYYSYLRTSAFVRSDLLQDAFDTVPSTAVMLLEFWRITPSDMQVRHRQRG